MQELNQVTGFEAERDVLVFGNGTRVLLIPGGGDREGTWSDQLPLSQRYQLLLYRRRGYGDRAERPLEKPSFVADGDAVATLLSEPAHLVAFSGGGPGALMAAARRPERVLSLTLIEPATHGIARGHPAVDNMIEGLGNVWAAAPNLTPEEFDQEFVSAIGMRFRPPPLTPVNRARVESLMLDDLPWEAELPIAAIGRSGFPKLVVSGGWSDAYEVICDRLARQIGAERTVIPGFYHAVQHTGDPFNARLEALWSSDSVPALAQGIHSDDARGFQRP